MRGKTIDAIKDANTKVNRALKAGAMAVNADVEIMDHPGYMPYTRDQNLEKIMVSACEELVEKEQVKHRGHSTGSTDMGDFSCLMPTTSIGMGGCQGPGHSREFRITDSNIQYILPAKAITVAVIDLLYDNANSAKNIIDSFKPSIKRQEYTKFMHSLVE